MMRLFLIATLAIVLAYIGQQRVCIEDTATGEIICGPFESPVSPAERVVYREWLPVILK